MRRFLATDDEAEAVHADNLRAHRLGINGVPCFVVDGSHAIAGAQEPEVIERLLDIATVDAVKPGLRSAVLPSGARGAASRSRGLSHSIAG